MCMATLRIASYMSFVCRRVVSKLGSDKSCCFLPLSSIIQRDSNSWPFQNLDVDAASSCVPSPLRIQTSYPLEFRGLGSLLLFELLVRFVGNAITDAVVSLFNSLLSTRSRLNTLNVCDNKLTDNSLKQLAHAVADHASLERISYVLSGWACCWLWWCKLFFTGSTCMSPTNVHEFRESSSLFKLLVILRWNPTAKNHQMSAPACSLIWECAGTMFVVPIPFVVAFSRSINSLPTFFSLLLNCIHFHSYRFCDCQYCLLS